MADIALLIAEDYESRTTKSIEKAGRDQGEKFDLISYVSLLSQRFDGVSFIRNAQEKFDFAKIALHPKSELCLAAVDGFFSA